MKSISSKQANLRAQARELLSEAHAIKAIYDAERRRRGKARVGYVRVAR